VREDAEGGFVMDMLGKTFNSPHEAVHAHAARLRE